MESMKRISLMLLALTLPAALLAQTARGSYFFENSVQRTRMNAAFAPGSTHIAIPVVGNLNYEAYGNVGLGNFVFPLGANSYSFMSERVTADRFLSQLPAEDPYASLQLRTDLLAAGRPLGLDGYVSAGLTVAASGRATVPNELFRIAKTAHSGESYSFDGLGARMNAYASLWGGFRYDMGDWIDGLFLGGRFQLLFGLWNARMDLGPVEIALGEESLTASLNGSGRLAGLRYDSGFDLGGFGIRGLGAAVDLGAEYRLSFDGFFNGLNFSASVNDLGAIGWFRKTSTLTAPSSIEFSGADLDPDDIQGSFNRALDELKTQASPQVEEGGSYSAMLPLSVYAGVEAPFFNEMMSVGVLYYNTLGLNNVMVSYNVSPTPWLNLGVSGTFGAPVGRFGFYVEVVPKKYVSFFAGMERSGFRRNAEGIPISRFAESLSMGLNLLL